MKTNKLIVIIFCVILILIVYNLYKNDIKNYNNLEHFSILNKLKKKNKNNNNNNNDNDKKENMYDISKYNKTIKSLKSEKTGITFEELLKASEEIDPKKISISNMKKEISDYNDSFKKEKFKNNSKNTSESFEKFSLYKDKLLELFKF